MADIKKDIPGEAKQKDLAKNSAKRFDTTSILNLSDTFGADEITLVDEIPDLDQSNELVDQEESVTIKIAKIKDDQVSEVSKVSKKLKNIEKKIYSQSDQFHLVNWLKNILSITISALTVIGATLKPFFLKVFTTLRHFLPKTLPQSAAKKITVKAPAKVQHQPAPSDREIPPGISKISSNRAKFIFAGGVLFAILFLWAVIHFKKSTPDTAAKDVPSVTVGKQRLLPSEIKNPKISQLTFSDIKNKSIDGKAIKAGSRVNVKFAVTDWQGDEGRVKLAVDVRVYASTGKLELFQPKLLEFNNEADNELEQVAVNLWANFTKDTVPGFYRVVFSVLEETTGRRSELQSNIKIIP